MRKTLSLTGAFAGLLLLAGCTVSVTQTVDPKSLATEVAAALQKQVGTAATPVIDCGEEMIDLKDGVEVACLLVDPDSGTTYDAPVVLKNVDGTSYGFDVEVAQEPNK